MAVREELRKEQDEVLEQRIARVQESDLDFIESLEGDIELSPQVRTELERIYLDVSDRHHRAVDDAANGRVSWDDARATMSELQLEAARSIQGLVSPEQLEAIAKLGREHGTTLQLTTEPTEAELPSPF